LGDVLAQTNTIKSNGYLTENNRLYLTLTDASIRNIEQLENTVVLSTSSNTIRVKDISKVQIAGQVEYVKIKANGKDVPLVAIMKQPESNLSDIDSK
jgi:cobalt-zinc-cadmium resistance protein CzcA